VTSSSQDSDDESPKKQRKEASPPMRSPPVEISPEKAVPVELTRVRRAKEPIVYRDESPEDEKKVEDTKAPVEESPTVGRSRRRLSRLGSDTKQ